jgi:hypothetical protein
VLEKSEQFLTWAEEFIGRKLVKVVQVGFRVCVVYIVLY